MTQDILALLGGIGLFLFGMQTMTGALRRLASRNMRAVLARFTRTPLSGAMTGAAVTATIQSSSATVMTTIGFVGAGLLTFPQAVGVVMGANVGTTATGWMVAILGIKLALGKLALPLLFLGSLAMLLGRRSVVRVGEALAGFALVFLGLDMMATATATVEPLLSRSLASSDTLSGLFVLIATGFAFTAVVQSSSAGVATVLVLLGGGALSLMQAAALVIGMDIGTTLKSLLATLGGGRDMRRTAAAHVGYNIVTAVVAFLLLGFVPHLLRFTGGDETTALVIFHTLFNVSGAVLLLPVAGDFARLIERIVPGGRGTLPEPLDRALLAEPEAALDAARSAGGKIAATRFRQTASALRGLRVDGEDSLQAIEDIEEFLTELAVPDGREGPRNRLSALLHLTDHLNRFQHRASQSERIAALARDPALRRPARALAAALDLAAAAPADSDLAVRLGRLNHMIAGRTARLRRSVLLREHVGLVSQHDVFALTDALRWLERVSSHAERIVHYGAAAAQERPAKQDVQPGG